MPESRRFGAERLADEFRGLLPVTVVETNEQVAHQSEVLVTATTAMVGDRIYREALRLGLGQHLQLWDTPKWL